MWQDDGACAEIFMACDFADLNYFIVRLPREPQEVHSWHQDGLWWSEEGEGQE